MRKAALVLLAAVTGLPVAGGAVTQVPTVQPGTTTARQMSGEEAHEYRVFVQAGQALRVRVTQIGVDVVLGVLEPDGQLIAEVDSPTGDLGEETVTVVAAAAGDYVIRVRPYSVAAGRYEMHVEPVRTATAEDRQRATVYRTLGTRRQLHLSRLSGRCGPDPRVPLFADLFRNCLASASKPTYTSLDDLERHYLSMDLVNYAWYQTQFERRAIEIYEREGLTFLSRLKSVLPVSEDHAVSVADVLTRLEQISPGFVSWGESLGRRPPGAAKSSGNPDSIVDWLRSRAQPITHVEPHADQSDLLFLKPILGSARVMGLGEATHGKARFQHWREQNAIDHVSAFRTASALIATRAATHPSG